MLNRRLVTVAGLALAPGAALFIASPALGASPEHEATCLTDPEADAIAEAQARARDDASAAADQTQRTINEAIEIANAYWKAQLQRFEAGFTQRAAELVAARELGGGPPLARWEHVVAEPCRILASRDRGGCDSAPDPARRLLCLQFTTPAPEACPEQRPLGAWTTDLACDGGCCQLLHHGEAAACEAATGAEARSCDRVAGLREAWSEECGPAGDPLRCVLSLLTLAHQHGESVCDWPALRFGDSGRTLALGGMCEAVLTGRPDRCRPTPAGPGPRGPGYRAIADSTLIALHGAGWWVATVMGSLPSVCAVEASIREPGLPERRLRRILFTAGDRLWASQHVRLGAETHAQRATLVSRAACTMTVTWAPPAPTRSAGGEGARAAGRGAL